MAMGSGAFLVQAARYLSERLMEAWDVSEAQLRSHGRTAPQITPEGALATGAPTETLIPREPTERQALALRLVCDRCLYGVDKNPMAVEMAKLSLWLVTLDKQRPFTFLDHTLRCGDSLLGIADIKQVQQWSLVPEDGRAATVPWIKPVIDHTMTRALKLRRQIAATPVKDAREVEEKERLLHDAEAAMDLVRLGADLLVGSALAPDARERERLRQDMLAWYHLAVTTQEHQREVRVNAQEQADAQAGLASLRARAGELLGDRRPFHWPLEFPEVFGPEIVEPKESDGSLVPASLAEWTPHGPGFGAITGNPPFMGGQKITGALGTPYRDYLVEHVANGKRGSADLCAYFFLRAGKLVHDSGDIGLLATNTIAQGDTREVGLDQLVAEGYVIPRAAPSRPWPGTAALEVAEVWLRRGGWAGQCVLEGWPVHGAAMLTGSSIVEASGHVLDGQVVASITPFLTAPGATEGNPYRLAANEGKSCIGSYVLGMGFIVEPEEAGALIATDPRNRDVLFPYLNGEDINSRPDQSPSRWVINFRDWPLDRAEAYPDCIKIVRERAKPEREIVPDVGGSSRDQL
jgi:hypothetical protein